MSLELHYKPLKILELDLQDRPREKLMVGGVVSLSNAELVAILIGGGIEAMSAIDLAKYLLKQVNYNLLDFAKLTLADLKKFKGIGNARAAAILSALELAKRIYFLNPLEKAQISTSKLAYQIICQELYGKLVEEFWVILLNQNNRLIKKAQVSKGGITQTIVDPRVIFQVAIAYQASGIILVHNHPSGNLEPSLQDKELTDRLVQGAKILSLKVLDHLILHEKTYFSFSDQGLMIKD